MLIRIAEVDDLAAIVEIYNQAIRAGQRTADTEPLTIEDRLAWFNSHTPSQYPLIVATDNQKVIGYLTISAYREGRSAFIRTAEVSYYIHFEHHRQGVASHLLQHAIELCPALNIRNLIAMLLGSNSASIKFLEKFGFKQWGEMPKVAEFNETNINHLYYGKQV